MEHKGLKVDEFPCWKMFLEVVWECAVGLLKTGMVSPTCVGRKHFPTVIWKASVHRKYSVTTCPNRISHHFKNACLCLLRARERMFIIIIICSSLSEITYWYENHFILSHQPVSLLLKSFQFFYFFFSLQR